MLKAMKYGKKPRADGLDSLKASLKFSCAFAVQQHIASGRILTTLDLAALHLTSLAARLRHY
jgi:hypothetical protein